MPPATPPPALPPVELGLAPWLLALSAFGIALAWQSWRAGVATAGRAVLGALLPALLWLLLAALNPDRPTHLVLTPLGGGLAVSFCCGLLAARSAARRSGYTEELSAHCYLWSCAAALASARVFHWLGKLGSHTTVLAANGSDLSASGALLGASACAWWWFRGQPLRRRAWLDGFAPALGLSLLLGWTSVYLQDPTRIWMLTLSAAGLALASVTIALSALQRRHGLSFALAALGYGIVQLSVAWLDSARGITGWATSVASWLVILLAIVAGWVWRKGFTLQGI